MNLTFYQNADKYKYLYFTKNLSHENLMILMGEKSNFMKWYLAIAKYTANYI